MPAVVMGHGAPTSPLVLRRAFQAKYVLIFWGGQGGAHWCKVVQIYFKIFSVFTVLQSPGPQ